MTKNPDKITPALLDVIVMPNGEVLCAGKTLGWVTDFTKFLAPKVLVFLVALLWASGASAQRITWLGPKLNADQAAAVLRACTVCLANRANWPAPMPDGPLWITVGHPGDAGAASWLPWPKPSPRTRLDGTPLSQPPQVYGNPFTFLVGPGPLWSTPQEAKAPRNLRK